MTYPTDRLPRLVDAYKEAVRTNDKARAKGIEIFLNQKGFKFGTAGKLHDAEGKFTGH